MSGVNGESHHGNVIQFAVYRKQKEKPNAGVEAVYTPHNLPGLRQALNQMSLDAIRMSRADFVAAYLPAMMATSSFTGRCGSEAQAKKMLNEYWFFSHGNGLESRVRQVAERMKKLNEALASTNKKLQELNGRS